MSRCTHCGRESPEGARFCVSCGRTVGVDSARSVERKNTPSSADLARADRFLTEAFGLSDEGRLTDAVRVARQVVEINPDSTTAHSLLGTLYERLGSRDAAIREYQTVLSLSPGSTADRQRLNELLGQPATAAAPAPTVVIPKPTAATTRRPEVLYVGGGGALLVVVILAMVLLIGRSGKKDEPAQSAVTPPTRITTSAPMNGIVNPSITPMPAPGLPSTTPAAGMPATPMPEFPNVTTEPAAEQPVQPGQPGPLPAEMRQPAPMILPYPGYRPPGQEEPRVFLPGGGIILNTPVKVKLSAVTNRTGILSTSVLPTPATAHRLVLSGRYEEASEVYEAALARQPNAPPKVREELAMVYSRLQEPAKAARHYMQALSQYEQQLRNSTDGDTASEAEHGIATCRAALRALGIEDTEE